MSKVAVIAKNQTIPHRERAATCPISFAQQRLWLLDQLEPGAPAYNLPTAMRLTGLLNVPALEQSLSEVVRRHEALRTIFPAVEGGPVQVISPAQPLALTVVDLSQLAEAERENQARYIATEEARRPFDLAKGPLLRTALLRLAEQQQILLITMHHIISDGWSMGVLFRELGAIYEAYCGGRPSPLAELPIQYADYAVWQREWLQGEVLEKHLSYWKRQLAAAPALLELPTDRPRPAVQTFRGGRETVALSRELSEALERLGRREGASLFMVLLAAFQLLLNRYTGQDDIVVGTPITSRHRVELEGLIGFFVNTLVLRTDLSGNPSFRELLGRVREVALGAYAHQDVPFEKLVEELQPERSLSHTPLFQVFLNLANTGQAPIHLPGVTVETLSSSEAQSKFDLTLYVREEEGGMRFNLVYNADLFGPERKAELLQQFQSLLAQAVANPGARVGGFSLVTPRARALLPDPRQPLQSDWHGPVQSQFSRQAERVPQRLAVEDGLGAWTYRELEARSNQLAHYLLASGIHSQDVVAIYGHRSAPLVWALLGILKAGAAFLILDPAYPATRLIDCLRAARPQGWLQLEAAGPLSAALQEYVDTLNCRCRLHLPSRAGVAERGPLQAYSPKSPQVEVGPDDLAYFAFTSGSTGEPKGIVGTHRPLSHFFRWHVHTFGLTESDRFSMLSGLSHDPLLRDVFTPLCLGSTLCIPGADELETPGRLADWMQEQQVSVAHLTPAMGQLLAGATPLIATRKICSLRYAFFGGDVLTRQDVRQLRALAPSVRCVNFYGATETPQAVGYFPVPACEEPEGGKQEAQAVATEGVPVGSGVEGVQLLILNEAQQLTGIGEVGVIHVRSPYLAKGYLGDEALERQQFINNPYTTGSSDRLYKTGDLARYLPDGEVQYIGRADTQVKIRSFRIELGEIEAVLRQHPSVQESVVIARGDVPGDKRLVAYFIINQQAAPSITALRQFVQERLPQYMVPATFVLLDALPLTPNGKVDRRALPASDQVSLEQGRAFVGPRDTLELQLTQIWQQVLGLPSIGIRDNFFELGGHSLLAVRLLVQIQKAFDKKLPLATLFQAPSVEQLAHTLRQQGWSATLSSLVPIQPSGSKRPFFCVPGDLGNVYTDLGLLTRHLGPHQPFYGLQDGLGNPTRIETLAAHYISEIRTVQPHGPYLLGGVCRGGVVAFEMAQQLHALGQQVDLLALIEPTNPPFPSFRSYFDFAAMVSRRILRRLGHHWRAFSGLGAAEQQAYLRLKSKLFANKWAVRRYTPRAYSGRITLFLASESLADCYQDPRLGWGKFAAGGIDLQVIPGSHDTITGTNDTRIEEAHMQVLAAKLRICIDTVQLDFR
jgi:amino acid adenylation domain-containing protein